ERVLVGHPFNPPHIIPLVEVVGGARTAPGAIKQAMAFYASIGKKPIQSRKELPGHVANRLQAALYREMLYLIEQDVLSVDDTDVAVSAARSSSTPRVTEVGLHVHAPYGASLVYRR